MRRVVANLSSGEQVIFEESRTSDGLLHRHRYETESDGHVSVFSDHTRVRSDGVEEVVDTFRVARFSPDKLAHIEASD